MLCSISPTALTGGSRFLPALHCCTPSSRFGFRYKAAKFSVAACSLYPRFNQHMTCLSFFVVTPFARVIAGKFYWQWAMLFLTIRCIGAA
ncbi:hypothetical protein [Hydrotalea sp.]|uniref:hypothetical protein n=1 Tax=Hydrotalea sp. TaxID=2881279 RepID=UPI002610F671|nr:hypothetical protein [Hydrotalea sp.]